jgi:multidrug resistance efflux pump
VRLAEADAAYQAFLTTNNLGDYAAQRSGLTQMLSQLESQKYSIEAQLQERAARLASLEGQLLQIAPEIGLSRDSNNSDNDRLAQLRLQREELLARYQPDAQPVTDLEAQIRQLESAIAQGRTQAPGARRFGINPVYQTLQTEKIQLASEIAALRGSGEANLRQISDLDGQIKAARQQLQYGQLRTPVTGIVFDVRVSPSSVVAAAAPVLAIVPGGTLEARVLVPSKVIGFIRPGMKAKLSIDTFPSNDYGRLPGQVGGIGSDALTPEEMRSALGASSIQWFCNCSVSTCRPASGRCP